MIFTREYKFHSGKFGAAIAVRIIPRARTNEISTIMQDGTIKIKLTAPPVGGKANEALIEFLSEMLGIPKTRFEIVTGSTNRNKLVAIEGIDAETLQKQLIDLIH